MKKHLTCQSSSDKPSLYLPSIKTNTQQEIGCLHLPHVSPSGANIAPLSPPWSPAGGAGDAQAYRIYSSGDKHTVNSSHRKYSLGCASHAPFSTGCSEYVTSLFSLSFFRLLFFLSLTPHVALKVAFTFSKNVLYCASHDTSLRLRRRLPPCPLVIALVPFKCSS